MLTNIAVNRMLEVYKGLDNAIVYNTSNQETGRESISWNNPSNKRITVKPFYVVSNGANTLNKLDLKGRVADGGDRLYNQTYQSSYQSVLDILNRSYQSGVSRVAHKAVYGSNEFVFLLFKSSDLTGVLGVDLLEPPRYNGVNEISEELYQFLWDNESQSLEDRILNIKLDTGSGFSYYLSIPSNVTYGVNEDSYLSYPLNITTNGDANIRFDNDLITEGIEMV